MVEQVVSNVGPIDGTPWLAALARSRAEPLCLSCAIAKLVKWHARQTVVSVNRVIEAIVAIFPECGLEKTELARLINESASAQGFVPVYDPSRDRPTANVQPRFVHY